MFSKVAVAVLATPLFFMYSGTGEVSAAESSKTLDYACSAEAPIVGPIDVDMEVSVTATTPESVEADSEFTIENSYTEVTILDTSLMKVAADSVQGQVTKFNLAASNTADGDKSMNVADPAIDIPKTPFPDENTVTFRVPGEGGIDVGPITAGSDGEMTISAGDIDTTLESNLGDIPAACSPTDEDTTLSTIQIDDGEEEDTEAPVISLNGDNPMELEVGEEYDEPGAKAEDDVDGDVSDDIEIDGEVDTNKPGEYEVTYTVTDQSGNKATETRTVIVKKPEEEDTEAPEITLIGDKEMELEVGEAYEEPGAEAEDNKDGDVTDNIEISGEVDTDKPGEYTVTYTVEDEAGNKAEETRTVTVVEADEGDEEEEAALKAVNKADDVDSLWDALENEDLGLNLSAVEDYNTYRKAKLAEWILENRPKEGYAVGYAGSNDDDYDASVQQGLNNANYELFLNPAGPDDPVEPAFNAVNDAENPEAMQEALEEEELGLDLEKYNELFGYEKDAVAQIVLENRPEDDEGYPLPKNIQTALDNAVEEFDNEGGAWFSGEGDPADKIGDVGDFYLDEESGDYYKKTDEGWEEKGNIKGEDGNNGENGEDGATWHIGEDEPVEDDGNVGDLYLDNKSGDVYLKEEDGWIQVANLKGEDGEDGQDGENCDCDNTNNSGSSSNGGNNDNGGNESKTVDKNDSNKTNGGVLPNTASNTPLLALIGGLMVIVGGALVFIRKKVLQ